MCDKIVSSSLANHRLIISFLRCRVQHLPRYFKNTMKKFFFVDMAYYLCSTFSQVHITRASSIPDHCSAYALTDTKEECLREMFDRAHDKSCPFCDRLKNTLKKLSWIWAKRTWMTWCTSFSRFQFGGKVFGKSFRSFGLDGRKGWWVIEYDFHGNFWVNITWFFAFFTGLLDWIILILVWFERSFHPAQVSFKRCPSLTIKTDGVTSSTNYMDVHGPLRAAQGRIGQYHQSWMASGWSYDALFHCRHWNLAVTLSLHLKIMPVPLVILIVANNYCLFINLIV